MYYNKIPALVWDKNMNIYICKNRFQEDIVTVHTEVFDIFGTSKQVTVKQSSTVVGSQLFPISNASHLCKQFKFYSNVGLSAMLENLSKPPVLPAAPTPRHQTLLAVLILCRAVLLCVFSRLTLKPGKTTTCRAQDARCTRRRWPRRSRAWPSLRPASKWL